MQQRIETRHWGSVADPAVLDAAAMSLNLPAPGPPLVPPSPAFTAYEPGPVTGTNGIFDPFTGGAFPFPFGRW